MDRPFLAPPEWLQSSRQVYPVHLPETMGEYFGGTTSQGIGVLPLSRPGTRGKSRHHVDLLRRLTHELAEKKIVLSRLLLQLSEPDCDSCWFYYNSSMVADCLARQLFGPVTPPGGSVLLQFNRECYASTTPTAEERNAPTMLSSCRRAIAQKTPIADHTPVPNFLVQTHESSWCSSPLAA